MSIPVVVVEVLLVLMCEAAPVALTGIASRRLGVLDEPAVVDGLHAGPSLKFGDAGAGGVVPDDAFSR